MLAQVGDRRQEHDGAALRMQPHEPLALERRERLAHRRRAHAEAARQLDLAQAAAGLQRAGHDVPAQALGDQPGYRAGSAQRVSASAADIAGSMPS